MLGMSLKLILNSLIGSLIEPNNIHKKHIIEQYCFGFNELQPMEV